jgi:hypothetical protein
MDIDSAKAPRTHAAWKKAYDAQELAKLMVELSVQLEVELNVATVNEAFAENKAYMLEKELKQAQDRIKRLQDWVDNLEQGHSHSGKNDNREWHGSEIGWLVPGQIVYIGEAKLMKMTYE